MERLRWALILSIAIWVWGSNFTEGAPLFVHGFGSLTILLGLILIGCWLWMKLGPESMLADQLRSLKKKVGNWQPVPFNETKSYSGYWKLQISNRVIFITMIVSVAFSAWMFRYDATAKEDRFTTGIIVTDRWTGSVYLCRTYVIHERRPCEQHF